VRSHFEKQLDDRDSYMKILFAEFNQQIAKMAEDVILR